MINDTDFDLNDFKISPNKIKEWSNTNVKDLKISQNKDLPNADYIGYAIWDKINITSEIAEVNNYSIDFLVQLLNMIKFGYNFIQDSFFNVTSTQYTVIFTVMCIIILLFIFLFSKNKPKDILCVAYFAVAFIILLAIKFVLKFLMICINHIKKLLKDFKKLWNRRDEMTRINSFTDFFYFFYNFGGTFFSIMITVVLFFFSLVIAGAICIAIQLLYSSNSSIFNAIKGMSDSVEPINTTQPLSFGSAMKQSMERL
jgi:hypothetical protein